MRGNITFPDCSINTTLDASESVEHTFSSPYYPNGYPQNKTCGWYITARPIRLVVLHIKYGLSTVGKDKVELYDVDRSGKHSLIDAFVGNAFPATTTVYSKYQRVYVLFKSDDQIDWYEEGLSISYKATFPGRTLRKAFV